MYLALGVLVLIVSLSMIGVICFTTYKKIKERGEFVISKLNLLYLAPTFLLIYCLHLIAYIFNGNNPDFFSLFSLIATAFDVMSFKVDRSLLGPICQQYPIYYVNFVLAYLTGVCSAILSVISFFSQRIRNAVTINSRLKRGCDIVLGDSEDSIRYLKNNRNSVLVAPQMLTQRYTDLIKSGLTVLRLPLEKLLKALKNGEYALIVFAKSPFSYSEVLKIFADIKKEGKKVSLYMEAGQNEVKIIKEEFITKTDAIISASVNCFSKYELIARQFVVDHPLTRYIPRSFYNDNLSLKNDKKINVVFIGFGKVNYQIFRMCSMQFQFAKTLNGQFCAEPVNYYICDNKEDALHNEFFSHILYEFDKDFEDCDFPKPQKICNIITKNIDINSVAAKKLFEGLVGENSFTYFIISLKTDLEDASYARTIERLLTDKQNYRIFVREKSAGESLKKTEKVGFFGNERDVYTHKNIVNDRLLNFAKRLNMIYRHIDNPPDWLIDIKKLPKEKQSEALTLQLNDFSHRELMNVSWESLPMIEQASNLYHALNLPFKLNLLGLEMADKDNELNEITKEEFFARYDNSGRKSGYNDSQCFFETKSGNLLAFIEHLRWNALYILYDYKQMSKKQMQCLFDKSLDKDKKRVQHKDVNKRLHACITTYYGLKELIDFKFGLLYPEENINNLSTDDIRLNKLYSIYRYDYMDLDDIYDLVRCMGYKIVVLSQQK